MNTVQINAMNALDAKARKYMQSSGCDYREGFKKACAENPETTRRYTHGDTSEAKKYAGETLPPARLAMENLVADPERTRKLATWTVDHLARQRIVNVGPGVPDSAAAYRQAVSDVQNENPSLAEAARSGYISDTDFKLLGLLVPAVAGEVERGNYRRSDDSSVRRYSADSQNHVYFDGSGNQYRVY
jgi:hypothetical protein